MAWTSADIIVIEQAIATGARKVRFADGREVTYQTLEEMLKLLALMKDEVAGTPPSRISLAKFTRD